MNRSWAASLLAVVAMAAAAPAMAQIAQARVTGGTVAGTVERGLSMFKGVPFAAPPVGPLRWKAPQPVKPWTGTRQTTAFGPGVCGEVVLLRWPS